MTGLFDHGPYDPYLMTDDRLAEIVEMLDVRGEYFIAPATDVTRERLACAVYDLLCDRETRVRGDEDKA